MFEAMPGAPADSRSAAGAWPDDPFPQDEWSVASWYEPYPSSGCWTEDLDQDGPLPGEGGAPFDLLAGLESAPPSGLLALLLEQADPAACDDEQAVELVAAWRRLGAWCELNERLAAGALSRQASMNPAWNAPAPADECVAADELAMRLACSRRSARRLVRDGRALDGELLPTADAVREGRLDGAQMRAVVDRLVDRPGELAWAVQEQVLPGATTRTPAQLERDVDRALLTADPLDAADRLVRAAAKRHVSHPKRLPDGMAGIWAVVPADDAVIVDATLDASARAAKALGSPLTLDQLRAETFTAALSGRALLAGTGTDGTSDDADGTAVRTAEAGGRPPVRIPRIRVNVTVAMSTLMGLDEHPGELDGFGPISAEQARALAAGGTWRRLVTDPLTARVLDVGRTRYRPPADLVAHVTARDRCCAGPGCSTPAERCDIDHTTEYHGVPANGSPVPGTTSAANLGPLSRRCHRLKTDGGFRLRQVAPGVFEWRTPAGLAYRVTPGDGGRTERLGTTRSRSFVGPHAGYPDEPPF